MALRKFLTLRRPPTGPAFGRPEDRLRGRLEGRTASTQDLFSVVSASSVVDLQHDCVQNHLWGMVSVERGLEVVAPPDVVDSAFAADQ